MGVKLAAFYNEANEVGGARARIKMAIITKLSTEKAMAAPDSPENIKVFQEALSTIKAGV
jgi:hypothetical protein